MAVLKRIFTREAWIIAVRTRKEAEEGADFRFLPARRDRFYSDPTLFEASGRSVLLFEDYRYSDRKALISACELHVDGSFGEIRPCLECAYHLSYPFVFAWQGDIFMLPESGNAKRVEVYRAVEFPWRWELHTVLIEGLSLVDATLFEHHGYWWMFGNTRSEDRASWRDLSVFYADVPFGPWTAHPRNPVVSSLASSRPAGRILRRGNEWLRPSQDCSSVYGRAVVFNRIDELTPESYRESVVATLTREWMHRNVGTHTYCIDDRFEAVDFRFRVPRRPLPYRWRFEQSPWRLAELFGSHHISS
jgi:hypothetical protein